MGARGDMGVSLGCGVGCMVVGDIGVMWGELVRCSPVTWELCCVCAMCVRTCVYVCVLVRHLGI